MNNTIVLDGDLYLDIPLDGEAESVIKVGHEPIFRPIEITENGHYEPDIGVDGFSSVDVDVPGYSLDDIASGKEPSGDLIINAQTIHTAAFQDCQEIKSIILEGTEVIGANSFYACTYLTSVIGMTVKNIGPSAFMNCNKLADVNMPKVQTIGVTAFRQCLKLAVLRIPSCISINANAFLACPLLTDIYLPNDASTYTRAPWGATNATIHYNTQFDENGEPI